MSLRLRLRQVAVDHRLQPQTIFADKPDRIVAEVIDADGRSQLLKITASAYRNSREHALCQAWSADGLSPAGLLIEPDALLREFVAGPLLDELPGQAAAEALAVGRLLARAHASKTSFPFPPMSEFLAARMESQLAEERLSAATARFIRRAAALVIDTCDDGVLAHGDLAPVNMFSNDGKLLLIDGRGHRGGSALDLADYAVRVHGGDPRQLIGEVVSGYGRAPKALAAQLAWLAATDCLLYPRSDVQGAFADEVLTAGAGMIDELASLWR